MADFSTSAELELEVPNRTLRDARSKIEHELGTVEVGISGDAGGGGEGTQLDTILDVNRQQLELAEDRNAFLEEIEDELKAGGGGGGGGGLLAGAAGGRAATGSGIGAGVLSGILSFLSPLTAFAPAARLAGGGISPGLFGKGGVMKPGEQEFGPIMGLIMGKDTGTFDPSGDFQWPEITADDMLEPVGESITALEWDVPAATNVLSELSQELGGPQWHVPTSNEVLGEVGSSIGSFSLEIPGPGDIAEAIANAVTGNTEQKQYSQEGRISKPNYTVNNDTTYNIEQTADVDEAVDEVRREQQRDLERLERRIKQNLPAGY